MNDAIEHWLKRQAELPLPKTVKTKGGVVFNPSADLWTWTDTSTNISLNFALLPPLAPELLYGLKRTLAWNAERYSPKTLSNRFNCFKGLASFLTEGRTDSLMHIGFDDFVTYKLSSLSAEYNLAAARNFYVQWAKLGHSGIAREISTRLPKLSCKRNPTGVASATLDPYNGPLTDLEYEALQSALNDAFERDDLDERALLEAYVIMHLGIRPIQLAQIKCGDLIAPNSPDGDYILRIPRVKQGAQSVRTDFKDRKITTQLGEPLAAYRDAVCASFVGRLADVNQAPLFPQLEQIDKVYSPGLEYHATSQIMSQRVRLTFESLNVISERLEGEPMPVSPTRLRRTFATRAAEEGWPLLVLAEMMDHSDTNSVKVYVGLTSRVRANFSRKIAMDMAPLAMAFDGRLRILRSEQEATRPGSTSRIPDLRIDQHDGGIAVMGNCGSDASCSFLRPVACYAGCPKFEPWLDAPHEKAFDLMLARREQHMSTYQPRIAAINDRAILGCAQIILRCRELHAQESV